MRFSADRTLQQEDVTHQGQSCQVRERSLAVGGGGGVKGGGRTLPGFLRLFAAAINQRGIKSAGSDNSVPSPDGPKRARGQSNQGKKEKLDSILRQREPVLRENRKQDWEGYPWPAGLPARESKPPGRRC